MKKIKNIKKLLKDTEVMMCITYNGMMVEGDPTDVMNLVTIAIDNLKEYMPKEAIQFAVENGLADTDEERAKLLEKAMKKMDNSKKEVKEGEKKNVKKAK